MPNMGTLRDFGANSTLDGQFVVEKFLHTFTGLTTSFYWKLLSADEASDIKRSFKTTYFVTTAPTDANLISGAQCRPLASHAQL